MYVCLTLWQVVDLWTAGSVSGIIYGLYGQSRGWDWEGGGGVGSRDRRNQLKSLSKNGWNQSERARAGEGRVVKQVHPEAA